MAVGPNLKTEIRDPKEIRNPNSETRERYGESKGKERKNPKAQRIPHSLGCFAFLTVWALWQGRDLVKCGPR